MLFRVSKISSAGRTHPFPQLGQFITGKKETGLFQLFQIDPCQEMKIPSERFVSWKNFGVAKEVWIWRREA